MLQPQSGGQVHVVLEVHSQISGQLHICWSPSMRREQQPGHSKFDDDDDDDE